MKKVITLLLAGTVCLTLAGCGDPKEEPPKGETPSVTVTESTDPVSLTSEKVDRTAWTGAFSKADNYGVKSVITVEETENGQTMSETITLAYRFDGDKVKMDLTLMEDGKTSYVAEGYLEFTDDEVAVWQRAKENDGWTEWDGETYSKTELSEVFSLADGLNFVKDKYANFSYDNTEKGYLATTSGLTAMQESINGFLENVFSQAGGDAEDFDVAKFVVKVNGGKPSACIAELSSKAPAPEARDMLPMDEEGGPNGSETAPGAPGDSETESGGGTKPGTGPDGGGTDPDGSTDPETDPDGGETEPGGESVPEVKIKLTQVYFDYGKVRVSKPSDIPAAPAPEETPTPEGTPGQDGTSDEENTIEIIPR